MAGILNGLESVHQETGLPIIFPIHPRTQKMMTHFNLKAPSITLTKTPRLPGIPPPRIKRPLNHHRFRRPPGGGVHPRRPVRHITREHRAAGNAGRWIERPGRDRCTHYSREEQDHAQQKTGFEESLWRRSCSEEDGGYPGGGGVGGVIYE